MSRAPARSSTSTPHINPALARNLERVAWLMDRAFTIPGTRVKVGLDAILGLVPVGGDLLAGIVQASLVLVALNHYRVPRGVAARMVANVLIDVTLGAIPILGDLFDVAFKANTRNLKLLEPYRQTQDGLMDMASQWGDDATHRAAPRKWGTPWRYIIPAALILVALLALVLLGFITLVRWLFTAPGF